MNKTCQICGQTARSIIDNTLPICSACSMFIRRNFEKADLLECKSNESCNLQINDPLSKSQQRRLCPSCRMKKSVELGLKMVDGSLIVQHKNEKGTSKERPVLPTVSTIHISIANDGWRVNNSLKLLTRSVEFFKRFIEKQLFFSSVHQNAELLPCSVNTPRLLYFDEYALIESRVLMFACETIAEILSDFQNITTEDKKKSSLGHCTSSIVVVETLFYFPTVGDPRLALFPAYYIDLSNFRPYFRALNDEQYENLQKCIEPFYQRIFRCAERCRRTRPTSVECAALFLLSIYDKLERLQIAELEATTFQEQLCRELGQHIREQSGSELDAYARLPRLMNCLYAGHEVGENYEDTYSIIGIMLPELRNTDWLEKPKVPESYIEIAKLNAQQTS
ncbi:hypothetical protein M3Y98_00582600 [Aphelenchoides besseyi]|nr:hypothetical protein M3Y98_00582600 [Aphelenchoides besseyi]